MGEQGERTEREKGKLRKESEGWEGEINIGREGVRETGVLRGLVFLDIY